MQCTQLEERIENTIQRVLQKQVENNALPSFVKKDKHFELVHFVGSIRPEDLQIVEKNGVVHILGKEYVHEKDGSSCMYSFARQVPIPKEGNQSQLTSHLQKGYLTLVLPHEK
jgi:hypothetical protein